MIKSIKVEITATENNVASFSVNDIVVGNIAMSGKDGIARVIITETGARTDFYDLGEFTSPGEALDAITDIYLSVADAHIKMKRQELDQQVESYFGKQVSALDVIQHLLRPRKCSNNCAACKTSK
ncbi:hypothetical protein [Rahnella sp. ChDrAdgB13]|uniref:hypothetical protein n=1 Tax=Rahnella sp. ChDrAdgB13 TaxID=1850581 RepID=UPI001AD864B9|nr:hypothetical protein [Rahnella sp. ChDrAdgB13]